LSCTDWNEKARILTLKKDIKISLVDHSAYNNAVGGQPPPTGGHQGFYGVVWRQSD